MTASERREHARTRIWFPVHLAAKDEVDVLGVCYDVSKTGILVSTATQVEQGAEVRVTLRIPPQDPIERTVRGRVVRSGRNEDDPDGIWRFRIALEFEEPIPELEGLLDEIVGSSRRA